MGIPALRAVDLSRNFGGLMAINSVSLSIEAGERRAIIGPNGAGKTTLFNLLSGELRPLKGQIFFFESDVTATPTYGRARLGIGRTFQHNSLFPSLTAFENVRLSVQAASGIAGARLFTPVQRLASLHENTARILRRFDLLDHAHVPVRDLSYGVQRQLEIALALAANPRVLLLDEPTAGMSPAETKAIARLIRELPREITLVVIEHDMDVVFEIADRVTVLHYGEIVAEGTPEEVKANQKVVEIYLGVDGRL